MADENITCECDQCGHVYSGRYGQEFWTEVGARWLCHGCGADEVLDHRVEGTISHFDRYVAGDRG